jgi:excisionase family DNA binding protein
MGLGFSNFPQGKGIQIWRQIMDSNEKWLSVKEVSGQLGWSVDTIRRLVHRGTLKALHLPGKSNRRKRIYQSLRIAQSEIERFVRCNVL